MTHAASSQTKYNSITKLQIYNYRAVFTASTLLQLSRYVLSSFFRVSEILSYISRSPNGMCQQSHRHAAAICLISLSFFCCTRSLLHLAHCCYISPILQQTSGPNSPWNPVILILLSHDDPLAKGSYISHLGSVTLLASAVDGHFCGTISLSGPPSKCHNLLKSVL